MRVRGKQKRFQNPLPNSLARALYAAAGPVGRLPKEFLPLWSHTHARARSLDLSSNHPLALGPPSRRPSPTLSDSFPFPLCSPIHSPFLSPSFTLPICTLAALSAPRRRVLSRRSSLGLLTVDEPCDGKPMSAAAGCGQRLPNSKALNARVQQMLQTLLPFPFSNFSSR